MTTWETMGTPPEPPRHRPVLQAVAVVAALAVGFLVGVHQRGATLAGVRLGGDPPRVAVGAWRRGTSTDGAVTFVVPVYNGGDRALKVGVAEVPGWPVPTGPHEVTVAAGAWADLTWEPPTGCPGRVSPVRSVRLRVAGTGVRVPLAKQAEVLSEYAAVACAPLRRLTPRGLVGVWLVDEVYGRWSSLEDRHVLVFRPDGRFVADPEGVRFTAHRGVRGRYRLAGDRLTASVLGFVGYACLPGQHSVWRAGRLPDGRVSLTFLGGPHCPDQPHEWWVLRRLYSAGAGVR